MTVTICFFQGIILFLVGQVYYIWLIVSLFAVIGLLETAVNVNASNLTQHQVASYSTLLFKQVYFEVINNKKYTTK